MKLRCAGVSPGDIVALPRGYRFAAASCGLKKRGRLDLALVTSDAPASAAAVFTTNRVRAAPVELSLAHLAKSGGRMRAIVVNSGNANCATGPEGIAAACSTAEGAARALACRPVEIMVCSTGVIGVPLRVGRILAALPALKAATTAAPKAFAQFSRAILTTDTRRKWAHSTCRIGNKRVRLLGCAKGAGMIAPRMATMLAFVFTDAAIGPRLLRRALRDIVRRTFNTITVDGDTSTNDTLAVLANGAAGARPIRTENAAYRRFRASLERVCRALALAIVADGEGARRVVEIEVRNASSDSAAGRVARTIAESPLVKTAIAGGDPNWGRILAAAGRAGVAFDPARTEITMAGVKVYGCSRGPIDPARPLPFNERQAHRKLLADYVPIVVDLGGKGRRERAGGCARIWTCDFTGDYVRINASYRT